MRAQPLSRLVHSFLCRVRLDQLLQRQVHCLFLDRLSAIGTPPAAFRGVGGRLKALGTEGVATGEQKGGCVVGCQHELVADGACVGLDLFCEEALQGTGACCVMLLVLDFTLGRCQTVI